MKNKTKTKPKENKGKCECEVRNIVTDRLTKRGRGAALWLLPLTGVIVAACATDKNRRESVTGRQEKQITDKRGAAMWQFL
jgi:hypothetical protein